MERDSVDARGKEIVGVRIFDAPREMVFRAWTDPDALKAWWGPKGFTNTFDIFEPRPGGSWKFVMHGPDGRDYPNIIVFLEIKEPERIVLDHVVAPFFKVIATFEEEGADRTKLTFRMIFRSEAERKAVEVYAVPGNKETFDKLAAYLAEARKEHRGGDA